MTLTKTKTPSLIWFEPTAEFIAFVVKQADGRPVVDVGAGAGLLSKTLSKAGLKVLAIDLIERACPLFPVNQLDATTMTFPVPSLPIIARPCHSEWIERAIHNAMRRLTQFLYVGLKKNFATDLGPLRKHYQVRIQRSFVAGKDGELAVFIYKLPQFKTP